MESSLDLDQVEPAGVDQDFFFKRLHVYPGL